MVGANRRDAAHWEFMKFLQARPHGEPAHRAHHAIPVLGSPGMEDVEGRDRLFRPPTYPGRIGRNFFSDRIVKRAPGDIVFMDLAALTLEWLQNLCYYRTYCAGKEPTSEQKRDIYGEPALKWLYDLDQGG